LSWRRLREREDLRVSLQHVLGKIGEEHQNDQDLLRLTAFSEPRSICLVRLVNDGRAGASSSKDVDFSYRTVTELWENGLNDVRRATGGEAWRAATEIAPVFQASLFARESTQRQES
jgi:hypothetical protein